MCLTSSRWHMVHVHNKWPLNWGVFLTHFLHIYYIHNHCLCVEPSTHIHQWVHRCTITNTVVQSSTPLYRHQHHCTVINTVVQSSCHQHRCTVLRFNPIGFLRNLPHSKMFSLYYNWIWMDSWRIFFTQGYVLCTTIQYDWILEESSSLKDVLFVL